MNKIINFLEIKQQKTNEQLNKIFSKANTLKDPYQIDKLVEEKSLAIQDHKLFLAFLKYLEEKQIEPKTIFNQVLTLPKHQFEEHYQMNWQSVVQLCFTFLAILKENDYKQYEQFIKL
ncbi:hypothetical protein [Lysinibacillus endophyticus]|uniref:Uncharacterized protein n=1 Tax=Ureibacillus endophyticus TaxID=1978490 RepID=A0A494Z685_9BACL|nr:hypothetical protein [Lysinibacillus endophyticus]RKQ18061.1 hypothetical protein D8M03_06680 [Lysinibacillus endophyticus]